MNQVTGRVEEAGLRARVLATYGRLASEPAGAFHFHRGLDYAVDLLGYDREELSSLPPGVVDRFAGVGNPLAAGPLRPGETVLDVGCGAGTDLLLAARRVGPRGTAIGVDMTPQMRELASRAARLARLAVDVRDGLMEALPVVDASVDAVLSNGVVNLAPDKAQVFREIRRVLRPGGRLMLADVVVRRPFSGRTRGDPELWAACVAGAMTEEEVRRLAADAGLGEVLLVMRHPAFRGTAAEGRVARELEVQGATFLVRG